MNKTFENVTIIFKSGSKESCDKISITSAGVYISRLESEKNGKKNFVNYGFIPKEKIQKIILFDNGITTDIFINNMEEKNR